MADAFEEEVREENQYTTYNKIVANVMMVWLIGNTEACGSLKRKSLLKRYRPVWVHKVVRSGWEKANTPY